MFIEEAFLFLITKLTKELFKFKNTLLNNIIAYNFV